MLIWTGCSIGKARNFISWQSSSETFKKLVLERPAALVAWTIAIGTAFRFAMAAAGLDFDHTEAYYIANSRSFELSYFDHPPLAFWIAWLTRTVTGADSLVTLRAPFIAMFIGTTWMMYQIGARLFDQRSGAAAALLLNLSPLFTISFSAWVQPDGPMTFLALASILLIVRLEKVDCSRERLLSWLGVGACLGLALLSKYAAVVVAIGLLLFAITSREHRRWFSEPGPYLGAVLALAIFSPVVIWNWKHDWVSFVFQGQRPFEYTGLRLGSLLETIAGQAALIGPWIWVPCIQAGIWGLARGPADWRTWLPSVLGATPIVLFSIIALWASSGGHHHWQAPGYLLLFPLVGHFVVLRLERADALTRNWLLAAASTTVLLTALMAAEISTGVFWNMLPSSYVQNRFNPALKGLRWKELRPAFEARGFTGQQRLFVATTARGVTGKVDFEIGDKLPVFCLCGDARNYAFSRGSESVVGWDAVIAIADDQEHQLLDRLGPFFEKIDPVGVVEVRRGAQLVIRLHLHYGRNYLRPYPTSPETPEEVR
ncbi:hypothetical protein BH10PSE11_BH10PSE11_23750 [soil metagenome]